MANQPHKLIVIGSVLKPVDDVRNYRKLARSIANQEDTEVLVCGFAGNSIPAEKNISFAPLYHFGRLSAQRLFAPVLFLKFLLKHQPSSVIVCTHELLWAGVLYKLFSSASLTYDVQENYYLNILYSGNFSGIIKYPVALYVRCKEMFCSLFINRYILAESCYASELSFVKNRYEIKENKPLKEDFPKPKGSTQHLASKTAYKLIYSGTIAESYGIFQALSFTEKLIKNGVNCQLSIVGFCPDAVLLEKLKKMISGKAYVQLITDTKPISHQLIVEQLTDSDIALLPYIPNKATRNRIPTKLYECIALQLPVLITENEVWGKIITQKKAGKSIDFNNFSKEDWHTFIQSDFYPEAIKEEDFWGD